MNAMTNSMSGMSTRREALRPFISLSAGTWNGLIVMAIPLTSTRLNRFAPTMFPSDREEWPFTSDVMAVTSSGSDVPSAMKVRAMTDSGTPRPAAMIFPLSTRSFAPTAMRAAPRTR